MKIDIHETAVVEEADRATSPVTSRTKSRLVVLVLGTATIFAAAFLLFSLQPLVGKIVLPRFGGSAAVWSVCLVFFQTALLAGYAIAYGITALRPQRQLVVYPLLWLGAAVIASIPVGEAWRLTWFANPASELLLKLLRFVALPCVLVSTVSVVVQVWARLVNVKDPYAFYAVSNIGSLGALLAYPTLIEPRFSVPASALAWTWGFRVLALLVVGLSVAVALRRPVASISPEQEDVDPPPLWRTTLAWMFFAAIGSGLLVSFTSRMTQDIAPIPMLWIIPLALYLLTFIVCFGGFYRRDWVLPLALIGFAVHTFVTLRYSWPDLGFARQIFGRTYVFNGIGIGLLLASFAFLFLVMLVHGELYELRPRARYLSRYYVAIAAGGALGGAFVSLAAPFLFKLQLEYPILLGLALGVSLWVTAVHGVGLLQHSWLNLAATLSLIAVGLGLTIRHMAEPQAIDAADVVKVALYRNVYGPMRVEEGAGRKIFLHGTTTHGMQLTAPDAIRRPVSYYSVQSAVGMIYQLFTVQEKRDPLRIGGIGLGVGTLAAYTRTPDMLDPLMGVRSVTFYELDPDVAEIAQKHFTFLKDAGADATVHFGDARSTLEQQPPQDFDMLVVDAFTGDGIPVHLLTREALELYLRHTRNDGAILFHISNRYLTLEPVLGNAAAALGLHAVTVSHDSKNDDYDRSDYVVISRRPLALTTQKWADGGESTVTQTARGANLRLWTDDYSNLFSVLAKP